MGNDFEKAFSDFLETKEYDQTEQAVFELTRAAFKAGWSAAQSNPDSKPKIFEIKTSDTE